MATPAIADTVVVAPATAVIGMGGSGGVDPELVPVQPPVMLIFPVIVNATKYPILLIYLPRYIIA
jgi:hypothetical protein